MKKIIASLIVVMVGMNANTAIFAANESEDKEDYVNYSIEIEDDVLNDAIVVSSDTYIKEGRRETVTVYEKTDGTIITDTLSVSAIVARSKNGSDTATRTRVISGWGRITITASFKWYTEGLFSYVKCTGMSSSYSLDPKVAVNTWNESYTTNYVSIGKAKAQVEYFFYNSLIPAQYQEGTFKITCTDAGTISDT